jgi:hypothetical protein
MRRDEYRDVRENEDLTLRHDNSGHAMATGQDGKAVCVKSGSTIHIEKFEMDHVRFAWRHAHPMVREIFKPLVGQPVSAKFVEYHGGPDGVGNGYAADAIEVHGHRFHLGWMKAGTKCYVGAKRVTLETKLGVGDPPVIHDPLPSDETPTVARAMARAIGLCSVTR